MRTVYYVILAFVVLAAVRIRRLRARRARDEGGGAATPARAPRTPRLGASSVLGDTGLVAAREIRERVRGRIFRVVTVLMLVAVAAAIVIPTLSKGSAASLQVGVVTGTAAPSAALLDEVGRSVGEKVHVVTVPDVAVADRDLRAGTLDVAVDGVTEVLVLRPESSSTDSDTATMAQALSTDLAVYRSYLSAGLTPSQIAQVSRPGTVPVHSLDKGKSAAAKRVQGPVIVSVILTFVILTQYLTWTLMGVLEEKASRVVEVLLATVRPVQLLGGKVLGIGTVALVQAALLVAEAYVVADATGSTVIHGTSPLVLLSAFVWLVLGYGFYSWVYAAAGSMAERQTQVQSTALPLSAPIIFAYVVSLTAASSGSPSALVKVLAYLPPTAPLSMPVLVAYDDVSWWGFALSVLLTLGAIVAVALFASRVYRRAVLRTGRRVRVREALGAG